METFARTMENLRKGMDAAATFRTSEVKRISQAARSFLRMAHQEHERMGQGLHTTFKQLDMARRQTEQNRRRFAAKCRDDRAVMASERRMNVLNMRKRFHIEMRERHKRLMAMRGELMATRGEMARQLDGFRRDLMAGGMAFRGGPRPAFRSKSETRPFGTDARHDFQAAESMSTPFMGGHGHHKDEDTKRKKKH